jgi:hypothetical protein
MTVHPAPVDGSKLGNCITVVWSFLLGRSIKIFFKKFVEPQNQNHFDRCHYARWNEILRSPKEKPAGREPAGCLLYRQDWSNG